MPSDVEIIVEVELFVRLTVSGISSMWHIYTVFRTDLWLRS
jgi:hypothetical protein